MIVLFFYFVTDKLTLYFEYRDKESRRAVQPPIHNFDQRNTHHGNHMGSGSAQLNWSGASRVMPVEEAMVSVVENRFGGLMVLGNESGSSSFTLLLRLKPEWIMVLRYPTF